MIDFREDQAAGLRRLFRNAPPTVCALYAAGHRRREIALETATRLAGRQARVLILDECGGEAALAEGGMDLLHVLDGRHQLRDILQSLTPMVARVSVSATAMTMPLLDEARRKCLLDALSSLQRHAAHVLIHANPSPRQPPSPFVFAAPRRLLVAEATGRGATEAYSTIKHLAASGAGSLQLAVARARGRGDASSFFHTLEDLVRRHVGIPLAWMGELERDDLLSGLEAPLPLHHPREPEMAFLRRLASWGRGLSPAA